MFMRLLFVLLVAHVMALGQDAAALLFPSDGQIDVSPSARVMLWFQEPVDTARWINGSHPCIVLRDSIARVTPNSLWHQHRIAGTIALVDGHTVTWNPRRLLPATTYRCVVGNREYVFTTAPDVPRVVWCSIQQDVIRCDQEITFRLSSPLPKNCVYDSVVIIEQQDHTGQWSAVDHHTRIDGNTIHVTPSSSWLPNSQLRCIVRNSWYAGDEQRDVKYEAMVRGAMRIRCIAREVTGLTLDPEQSLALSENNRVVMAGDTISLSAPLRLAPDVWFSHWECPTIPSVHLDSSLHTSAAVSCSELSALCTITAVYERRDSVRIRFDLDTNGAIELYNSTGRLLHTITDTTVIQWAIRDGDVICVAKPYSTSSFIHWLYQGIKVASGAIVIPTLRAESISSTSINPKFEVLDPTAQELYRLRGSITDMDADPLFVATDAVRFTTPYEYESANPSSRTLCVTAQRCWEIVGYHDQALGTPIWFDEGLQDYCLTSELLDPENHVVFFVRRKVLDLRVEKILLGSEDPRDVMPNKQPHPEARIEVQRQENVFGLIEWVPMTSVECLDRDVSLSRYRVKCGDNIRFIVHPATHRGQQWRWWSALQRYAIPAGRGGIQPAVYTLVVDADLAQFDAVDCQGASLDHREIRVQAAFRQEMMVESVGLRVRVRANGDRADARFEERWFDPLIYYDTDADEPSGGRQLEYVARRGTPVRFRFSLPLEPMSVFAKSIKAESFDNTLITNPREDDLDFTMYADTNGNTNLLSSNGQYLDIVEFSICDPHSTPRKQALHTGSIDVTLTNAIHAFTGATLRTTQTFALRRMEVPGFGIKLASITLHDDGDWDFWPFVNRGEIYHAVYGANLTSQQALLTKHGFSRIPSCDEQQGKVEECTTLHGDTDGSQSYGDRSLWLQTSWMDRSDLAWTRISTWDEDCKDENDCLVNRIGDVIDSVRSRTSAIKASSSSSSLEWQALLPELIKTGLDIIEAIAAPDNQDDAIAEVSVLEDYQALWGMRSSQSPFINRYHENADYEFRGQWYTSRSVVR